MALIVSDLYHQLRNVMVVVLVLNKCGIFAVLQSLLILEISQPSFPRSNRATFLAGVISGLLLERLLFRLLELDFSSEISV